jgi:glycosyltransferase involved in cell wall biosynthesis
MKKNKTTVSIGIPAYNEAANIQNLLVSLLHQNDFNFTLTEIIIVSDHSTDATNATVRSFKDKRIKLLVNKNRIGPAYSQNIITRRFTGQILVLLNADIMPKNNEFIAKLISPILDFEADLVSPRILPYKPETHFEKILYDAHLIKNHVYENWKNSDNLYLCHGRTRAMSRAFAKTIDFPKIVNEDAFSYLYCQQSGYKFAFQKDTCIFFRLPANLSDHLKQSLRFWVAPQELNNFFKQTQINESYGNPTIPFTISRIYFQQNPLNFMIYIAIYFYVRLKLQSFKISAPWNISASTKKTLGDTITNKTKSNRPKTVSIGITVYNDAENITKLLKNLLSQKQIDYRLDKIYVLSDGSTDTTVSEIKKLKSPSIECMDYDKRLGVAERLNSLFKKNKSEICIKIDADVYPQHLEVINNLILGFRDSRVKLVSGHPLSLEGQTVISKARHTGDLIWDSIKNSYHTGYNIHNNNGKLMAVRKNLTKLISLPKGSIGVDDYIYLSNLKHTYMFHYVENAIVLYKNPDNLKDLFLQQRRLVYTKTYLTKYFGGWISKEYKIPLFLKIKYLLGMALHKPFLTGLNFILEALIRSTLVIKPYVPTKPGWTVSWSTKMNVKNYNM